MKVEWIPADGSAAIVLSDSPYRLHDIKGLSSTRTDPRTEKGPGQFGETAIDSVIHGRVVTVQLFLVGTDKSDYWTRRNELARAFVAFPAEAGDVDMGLLRITREDPLPVLEIKALPRQSPQETRMTPTIQSVDIELVCPDPYPRETSDRNIKLESEDAGLQFPLEHPFEMTSFAAEAEINNSGDIPVPIKIRLFGDVDTPHLENATTGEIIEVTGAVADGDFIEINTGFGQKSIELVKADGTRTNAMDRLNLAKADFFKLQKGINVLRFGAATNTSGHAIVDWRQQYAGI